MSNPRRLDTAAIAETAAVLDRRVAERFPDRGISRLAAELVAIGGETQARLDSLRRPRWAIRIAAIVAIVAAVGLLGASAASVDSGAEVERVNDWVVLVESGLQDLVFLGLGAAFLIGGERRLKRRAALDGLHELRSFAHVIDMHQLTKDPEFVLNPGRATSASPHHMSDRFELSRYLDYCSEMLSLISKLAALYAQDTTDAVLLGAVRDVQELTGLLSGKIWQKIVILDTLGQA